MITKIYELFLRSTGITTDTRKIEPLNIYFALKGGNFDGNTFADKALEMGALAVVVDNPTIVKDERYLLVDDVLDALQDIAHHHRKTFHFPFIGITGSNGKTTTKELCYAVLSTKYKTLATKGNLNNHIGVPLTLLGLNPSYEFAIIEMGANHPGNIQELCEIAAPTHGIITNVGRAHIEGFGSFEGVIQTKTEMYRYLNEQNGSVFIHQENEILTAKAQEVKNKIFYSSKDKNLELVAANPFLQLKGLDGKVYETNLVGTYNFENICAAVAIGMEFGISQADALAAIAAYLPTNNRSQVVQKENYTLIMDAYNANPSSVENALRSLAASNFENKAVILGDMFELGHESTTEHAAIVALVKNLGFAKAVFLGKEYYKVKTSDFSFFETKEEFISQSKPSDFNNHTILIKGSRGMGLETLLGWF